MDTSKKVGFVVCEESTVYDIEGTEKTTPIEILKGKKINHVSYDSQKKIAIFSSLYNENKIDDKIYFYKNPDEIEFLDLPLLNDCESRVVNIYNSGGNATFIHLGKNILFLYYFYIFIFMYIFLFLFYLFIIFDYIYLYFIFIYYLFFIFIYYLSFIFYFILFFIYF